MVAGAEGSSGAEWLHGHHRRYGDVYVNQGEEYALRLLAIGELQVQVPVDLYSWSSCRCRTTHV